MTPAPIFEVIRNGKRLRVPMSKLYPEEALALANHHLRDGDKATAALLYRFQHRQYETRKAPRRPPSDTAA